MWWWLLGSLVAAVFYLPLAAVAELPDGPALFAQKCAACHGESRLGGMGPALLPENLGRLKPDQARKVIAEGRPATQMPAFGERLSPDEVWQVHAFVKSTDHY